VSVGRGEAKGRARLRVVRRIIPMSAGAGVAMQEHCDGEKTELESKKRKLSALIEANLRSSIESQICGLHTRVRQDGACEATSQRVMSDVI
jgi:hypothetical protein